MRTLHKTTEVGNIEYIMDIFVIISSTLHMETVYISQILSASGTG